MRIDSTTAVVFYGLLGLTLSLNMHPLHSDINKLLKDLPLKSQFKIWTFMFQRPYSLDSEYALERYRVFKQNVKYIKETNAKLNEEVLGLGPFTDLSFEEFKEAYSNNQMSQSINHNSAVDPAEELAKWDQIESPTQASPDWSKVWPYALNQGESMSCWAFTTSALIEAALYRKTNKFEFMSPQSLIDCNMEGNHNKGCNGGWLHFSLSYLKKYGLAKDKDYPYTAVCGKCAVYTRNDCNAKNGEAKVILPYVKITNFRACDFDTNFGYPRCDAAKIRDAIKNGPYGTGIQITREIQNYNSNGTVLNLSCTRLDHAVLAVEVVEGNFIKFRNSWSSAWGEKGYGRIKYVQNGQFTACGLADLAYQVLPEWIALNPDYKD